MLSKLSVKKPFTVLVAVVIVIVLGIIAFTRMSPELLPEIDLPYVVVVTAYAGASPEEVEGEVTKPLEQVFATLDNIKTIDSSSNENYSMIILQFTDSVNMDSVNVDIREQISKVSGAWNDYVGNPTILKLNPDMLPVTVAAVDMGDSDIFELSDFVDSNVLGKLEGTEGVAGVSVSGSVERMVSVELDNEKILKVNAKISKAIIDKFGEAKDEINDGLAEANSAKQEIENGKSQLENGQKELADKCTSAKLQLVSGREQLNALKTSLQTQLAKVASQLQSLDLTDPANLPTASALNGAINALTTQISDTDVKINSVNVAVAQLEGQQAAGEYQIYSSLTELAVGEQKLQNVIDELKKALEQVEDSEQAALEAADLTGTVTVDMISAVLAAQNFSMPAGYVEDSDGTSYLVRVGDKISGIDELENLLIVDMGLDGVEPILLSSVCNVYLTDNSDETYAKINGKSGILLSFSKQSNYGTAQVADNISEQFKELEERFEGLHFTTLMDQGDYIKIVIDSVLDNLLIGAALAILILIIFLRDIRPTFIVACSIPLSVLFAIVLMYFSGVTLNIISMSGLAVGVGMLVDNSIVVIENIYRMRSLGYDAPKAAVQGARQVSGAIISSTLTTVCVFFPIVFVQGLTRQIFSDMALTITYSLLASLVVALTLIPAMSKGILKRTSNEKYSSSRFLMLFGKTVGFALKHKALFIIVSIGLLAFSAYAVISKGFSYMPSMESTEIMVSVELPDGTDFDTMAVTVDDICEQILAFEGVESVGAMPSSGMASVIGMGSSSEQSTDSVTLYVILNDESMSQSVEISEGIEAIETDTECVITSSNTSSLSSYSTALGGSGVEVKVFSDDIENLKKSAEIIADIVSAVDGVDKTDNGIGETTPELHIRVDKNKAMKSGLTTAQIFQAVNKEISSSSSVTSVSIDSESLNVVVNRDSTVKYDVDSIGKIKLDGKDSEGKKIEILLGDISDISLKETLGQISRTEQRRYIDVTATLKEGYNVTLVNDDVENALDGVILPAGCRYELSGENETIINALKDLLLMLLIGVLLVYLIMVAQFQSLSMPFIVMFTVPLAFTGGLLGLLICGFDVSIVSMIGFIMLVGVIVNNGIVLIDYINQRRISGVERVQAIVEAAQTRLRPILMTALTTVLALLPMAMGLGMGASLMQPLAVVCIGGLSYATLMTLYIVPVIYDLIQKREINTVTDEQID